MNVKIFTGLTGSGKSLSAVKECYNEFLEGRTIHSNTPLTFKHHLLTVPQVDPQNPVIPWNDVYDSAILLDEFHVWFDSRRAQKIQNIVISYFVTQARKRDVDFLITTQHIGQVDIRLQRLCNMMIQCEAFVNTKRGTEHTHKIHRKFCEHNTLETIERFYEHYIIQKVFLARIDGIPDPIITRPDAKFLLRGEPYWHFFETKKIILPNKERQL